MKLTFTVISPHFCRYTTKSDEARHYVQYDQGKVIQFD